jgi:acyl carrier protein
VVAAGARGGGVISFFALLGIFDQERSYRFGADLRFVLRLFLIPFEAFFNMNDSLVIREFLQSLLSRKGDQGAFLDNEELIAGGRLQSIDTLEVVLFPEEKYGIDFAENGFDQNQVGSIDNILALIGRR